MIEHTAPRFSVTEASLLAREHFGLEGHATALPSHLDQNFRLDTASGRFVLKLANTAAESEYVDLQQAVLAHLQKDGVQHFPEVVCARNGEQKVIVEGRDGEYHQLWAVTWLEGRVLADVNPVHRSLVQDLGEFLGRLDGVLSSFDHDLTHRDYIWDLRKADRFAEYLECVPDLERRELVQSILRSFKSKILPCLDELPQSVIHHDANDHNIIVGGTGYDTRVRGLIDFGDTLHTAAVVELAIAATYIMMGKPDPVGIAAELIQGYHSARPLNESEVSVLYELVKARLCSSVLVSAYRGMLEPDNEYIRISEKGAWALLQHLCSESPVFAEYRWRSACSMEPCPKSQHLVTWLRQNAEEFAPVLRPDLRKIDPIVFDLGVSSPITGFPGSQPDPRKASAAWFRRIRRAGAAIGIGRYDEPRIVYTAEHFRVPSNEFEETRTIHLGIDLFKAAGEPVYAPLAGKVHSLSFSPDPMDFGGVAILEHSTGDSIFYTLYGHLSEQSVRQLRPGQRISKGDQFAHLGEPEENGGWVPHLHFQVIADLLGNFGQYWGVAPASQRDVWLSVCPDPNLILGIPDRCFPDQYPPTINIQTRRKHCIGGNLSISYRVPLHIVRGYLQYLYDDTGRTFLDGVNNVPHVGHSHPRVNIAAARQMRVLNANTRYLHRSLVDYAERLAAKMPDSLSVCYFVNSGSEANDLALRLAFAHTGRKDIAVLDGAYHGHLSSLIAISPYKFDGPGGAGAPSYVHKALVPDVYRGRFRGPDAGEKYAEALQEIIASVPNGIAAFICESLLGCGGQIELPEGYLQAVYAHVRAAGGICIADEVQVGFGRLGSNFWGFETQKAIPDIVVLGKPMGNGHPLAGVVTTPEIAASFDNGMEFFSTFGGNPVSCMVGMAVLDVIESENLQENAHQTGEFLKASLQELKKSYPIIGDVRGRGLFLGVELVRDPETLEPADKEAAYAANRMRDLGVLVSTDGPLHNVLKIKPPLVFNEANAERLADMLDTVLREDGMQC
ncbi:MAG: aminotransferase class III-fold pyridoxal phosphate-dependent enzyme [Rhodothermaceae bacterium]|nr:aminotransferase class III-fold pyridoxal phosphate-dependent enzyme [Rhodothermaceae bacterium]MXX57673.1 aminotransferase class III-fold pyridoxal phosphate-dependent enzyme [Rhodothermaceae bacterium]MYD20076.1 aminotransferase class III-fold pyridoxal phosphate-dependent enzyme [Rhodothermaceae bacterium]MYD56121.1 aminotransferase class III-fold pyridoxal phosphate-dependent enzyme [Rhodothermaceae bacterium]MYI42558.1 aminotransferase class III-fold pyridoxal phosphate-dependent enzyme